MIGTTFNGGTVIAAMQHAEDPTRVAIVVRIQKRLRLEYGVGVVRVGSFGQPVDSEWDNGSYPTQLALALISMAECAKQVPVGDLGLIVQGEICA